jgi:hypothetical protein
MTILDCPRPRRGFTPLLLTLGGWRRFVEPALGLAFIMISSGTCATPSYIGSTDWVVLDPHACNATSLAQVPGYPNLFINRQLQTKQNALPGAQTSDCDNAGSRFGLTLDSIDWNTHELRILKVILDTSVDAATGHSRALVRAGPMRGLIIRSAYDASIVKFNGQHLVSYECTAENGNRFGIDGTSSCVSAYDPSNETLDLSRTQVVVSGVTVDDRFFAAAVPQLVAFQHHLYIYWSSLLVEKGKFSRISMRATELTVALDGAITVKSNNAPFVKGIDPANTTEVWGPDPDDPMSTTTTDTRAIWAHGDMIVAMASRGGSGCTAPSDVSKGCFRLVIAKAKQPIGNHIFNRAEKVNEESLPSNPQEYTTPVVDPAGGYWFIGHYIKPSENCYSEKRPVPSSDYWAKIPGKSALVLFPITDKSLWPMP